jgi:hypothetical protein
VSAYDRQAVSAVTGQHLDIFLLPASQTASTSSSSPLYLFRKSTGAHPVRVQTRVRVYLFLSLKPHPEAPASTAHQSKLQPLMGHVPQWNAPVDRALSQHIPAAFDPSPGPAVPARTLHPGLSSGCQAQRATIRARAGAADSNRRSLRTSIRRSSGPRRDRMFVKRQQQQRHTAAHGAQRAHRVQHREHTGCSAWSAVCTRSAAHGAHRAHGVHNVIDTVYNGWGKRRSRAASRCIE